MKINLDSLQGAKSSQTVTTNNKASNAKASEQAAPQGEQIQISELSRQLHAFESSVSSASGFDTKRVDEIKQAISEGRFKVNSEAVANKLVVSVQELLDRQKEK